MEDYVDEINAALGAKGEDFHYESIEDVKDDLELVSEEYENKARNHAVQSFGVSGAGVMGKFVPEFYSQIAEQMDAVTQNDLATVGLVGALGVSTVPAYLGKRNKDKRDEVNQIITELEEGSFDSDNTEFAYEVADKLS